MSDVIEAIRIIEDRTTKKGEPLSRVHEGDVVAGANEIGALVGMKLDGTFSHLAVNDLGQVIVENSPDIEARLWMQGLVVNSPIGTVSTIAEITLLTNKIYRGLALSVSASRYARFAVIHSDAGVDKTILAVRTSGANQNYDAEFDAMEFISGTTGLQKLRLVGIVKEGIATDLEGTIVTTEIQDT